MRMNQTRRRRLALLCCLGAGFGTLFDSAVVTYTVPFLSSELGAETNAIQWFLAAYSLTFGIGLVPGGRLGDVYGRRGLFIGGLAVFIAGALAAGLAPTIWIVVLARVAQGFGAGLINAQVLAIIQDEFAGTARVKALALYTMAGAAAAIVGPLAAAAALTWLPVEIGWRAVLLLNIPVIFATAVLAFLVLAKPAPGFVAPAPRRRVDVDVPGIVVLAGIVLLVTLPVIDPGVTETFLWVIVGGILILGTALAFWERRYAARGRVPLFVPALMRSRGFIGGNMVALLWFGAVVSQITIVTLFLLETRKPLMVALILVPASLVRIVSSSWSSRLYSRFGERIITVGLSAQALSTVALIAGTLVVTGDALLVLIVVIECWVGVMAGFVEPPLRAATLGFAPDGYRGVAASFLQLAQRLSSVFCVAFATGLVIGTASGIATPEGLRNGLLLCALLLASAAVVSGTVLASADRALSALADRPLGSSR